MLRRILSFVRTASGRRQFRRDLDDELAFHLEQLTEDLIASGLTPEQARREARLRLGSPERVQEESAAARGMGLLDELTRNLLYTFRGVRRDPLLSLTFLATLALAIGLSTTVFSVADAVLWRSLPYPGAERLARVAIYDPDFGKQPGYANVDGRMWERIREGAEGFSTAVYSTASHGVNLSASGAATFVQQQRVGAGFFQVLGVSPALGREFTRAEDVPDGPAVAILRHDLWSTAFDGDPDILGSSILLKGASHTVVGIMPRGFEADTEAQVWTPLRASTSGEGGGANYSALLRIPDGMSWLEAEARVGAIPVFAEGTPSDPERRFGLIPVLEVQNARAKLPLLIILSAMAVMVLVACANLAGLQVARALARSTETATRKALGGGPGALLRQTITENATMGVLGGGLGIGLAMLGVRGMEGLLPPTLLPSVPLAVGGRVLALAVFLTMICVLLFGLGPAVHVIRASPRSILVSGSRRLAGGGNTLRKALLVGQVAIVTVLLFGSGLLLRSYGHLADQHPGFDGQDVVAVQYSLDDARYVTGGEVGRFVEESLAAVHQVPSVAQAAVSLILPFERPLNLPARVGQGEDVESHMTSAAYVTPGYFETLRIQIRSGRGFTPADGPGQPGAAVVNRAFAETYLEPGGELGADIGLWFNEEGSARVVGIVDDVLYEGGGWGSSQPVWASPAIYLPLAQASDAFLRQVHVWFSPNWVIRTHPGADPRDGVQALEAFARDLPPARTVALSQLSETALALPRFEARFLVIVTLFALLLAGVGLYGIVAHEALERRPEMGLRMALGASRGDALWTTGLTGLRLGAYGLAVGGVLALVASRIVRHMVWGISLHDPVTLVGLIATVGLLVASATLVPSLRASHLNPADILRQR